ncbi:hypothetical protein [Micromonospora sp.]|uniref:hypothetical protein n=1 Tax=Micromonospora sp. TaxID=1876 RepID=UPI003B3B7E61
MEILDPKRNVGYGREEIPSVRDGRIRDLLVGVMGRGALDQVKRQMPHGADDVLAVFAERAASIAVRHQDVRELRAGILAVVISQAIADDPRESIAALSLLYRAAELIGHDPNSEFAAAGDVLGGGVSGLLEFLRRSPEDKSIEAMGYEEGDDGRGFCFISNW